MNIHGVTNCIKILSFIYSFILRIIFIFNPPDPFRTLFGLRIENKLFLITRSFYIYLCFSIISPALNLKSMETATIHVAIVDVGRLIL